MLYQGRGDLATVTSAATLDGYGRLRSSGAALGAAARACDAVLRLLDAAEPNRPAYTLPCRSLAMLDEEEGRAPELSTALAFRLKLALAAGFSPELASCARCGEAEHLSGFSGAAGGVVCSSCELGSFAFSEEAHAFMVGALAAPLAGAPEASERALRQARARESASSICGSAASFGSIRAETCTSSPPRNRGSTLPSLHRCSCWPERNSSGT